MTRFDYQRMVHDALRHVVRDALEETAELGLDGEHHFYIQFQTGHPDVEISPALRKLYPESMTIVLQQQFWDLEVDEEAFSVILAFNRVREYLRVPFTAIESFADPAAEFGLRFEIESGATLQDAAVAPADAQGKKSLEETASEGAPRFARHDKAVEGEDGEREDGPNPGKPASVGEVVQIDTFRRK